MQTDDDLIANAQRKKHRRVLLKFSGEALAGPENKFPIDPTVLRAMCQEVVEARREHDRLHQEEPEDQRTMLQIAIVVGGGNIIRGQIAKEQGFDESAADHMGMLATLINSVATQNVLEQILGEGSTRVLSALPIDTVAEPFIKRRATRHLMRGHIVIFGAGSGNPFFTTDTAAVLRAKEIDAEVILKASNVDGIYDKDPRKVPGLQPFSRLTFDECIAKKYKVMDQTAFTLAQEGRNPIPIRVFSMMQPGNIRRALLGDNIGTLVTAEDVPLAAE